MQAWQIFARGTCFIKEAPRDGQVACAQLDLCRDRERVREVEPVRARQFQTPCLMHSCRFDLAKIERLDRDAARQPAAQVGRDAGAFRDLERLPEARAPQIRFGALRVNGTADRVVFEGHARGFRNGALVDTSEVVPRVVRVPDRGLHRRETNERRDDHGGRSGGGERQRSFTVGARSGGAAVVGVRTDDEVALLYRAREVARAKKRGGGGLTYDEEPIDCIRAQQRFRSLDEGSAHVGVGSRESSGRTFEPGCGVVVRVHVAGGVARALAIRCRPIEFGGFPKVVRDHL